jgi:hypothetical protein
VETALALASDLLHLAGKPGKPAGVEDDEAPLLLATDLVHLPGKPAGVSLRHPSIEDGGHVASCPRLHPRFHAPRAKLRFAEAAEAARQVEKMRKLLD